MTLQYTKIADGLGFGDGAISGAYLADGSVQQLEALLNSDDLLVPVVAPAGKPMDDGCGDGRPVTVVPATGLRQRPKVFGGGACMAVAAMIATGQAASQALPTLFDRAIQTLQETGLFFGGHTDDAAEAPMSGCGAIDQAPHIIAACVAYRQQITHSLEALGVDLTDIDDVFTAFEKYLKALTQTEEAYSGRQIIDMLRQRGAEVRQLTGRHAEGCIILNTVADMAVNQSAVRTMDEQGVQAFTVDVWRLDVLASAFADTHKALLGELIYTLGTAAVLTKGDLPVYVVSAA